MTRDSRGTLRAREASAAAASEHQEEEYTTTPWLPRRYKLPTNQNRPPINVLLARLSRISPQIYMYI